MTDFFVKSGSGVLEYVDRTWSIGDRMVPAFADTSTNSTVGKSWVWEVTTGGTSTGHPTWPASVTQDSTTVTQNSVVWTARKPGYSSGSTVNWTFATTRIGYAVGATTAASDRVLVSSSHSETSSNTGWALSCLGTIGAPTFIICVGDGVTSGFASTTGAVCTTTGSGSWQINGTFVVYGITFINGTGNLLMNNTATNADLLFDSCSIQLGTAASNLIALGGNSGTMVQPQRVRWRNTNVKFSNATQRIYMARVDFRWDGGAFEAGSTATTAVFKWGTPGYPGFVHARGVDFGNAGSAVCMADGTMNGSGWLKLERCILPSSWTGSMFTSNPTAAGFRGSMYACDNADTNYRVSVQDVYGAIADQETIVRTGGASDGTTPISWQLATSAKCGFPFGLETDEIAIWNETVGSAVTVTIDVIHDSLTNLKDNEVWIELRYFSSTTLPQSSMLSDRTSDLIGTAADQTASTSTWTTTGLTHPNKQKVSATITPQEKGVIYARVVLAKPNYVLYVDPDPQVS